MTFTCPISPAKPSADRISPSMIKAAAIPVPTGIKIALRAPCAAPLRISATAAVRTSWPNATGILMASSKRLRIGRFFHCRLPDQRDVPAGSSSAPGTANPTASTGCCVENCATMAEIALTVSTPVVSAFGVGAVVVAITLKLESTRALLISVPPTSTATT